MLLTDCFVVAGKRKDKEAHDGHVSITDEVLMATRTKFRQYDTNDNGTIDRDELAGLLKALNLEKYVPSAADIEAKNGPPPSLPSMEPADTAALVAAIGAEDAIVEGVLKQLVVKSSASKMLMGVVTMGAGAIAGTDVPNVGGKKKKSKTPGQWLDRDASLTTKALTWQDPASDDPVAGGGTIPLEEIKRVTPTDIAEDVSGYAFEVALRTLVNDQSVVYLFSAESEEEREEWMDSLKQTIMQEVKADKHKAKSHHTKGSHKITDEELDIQMKAAFAAFDVNNSGSLDAGEIGAVAKQLGKDLTSAELAQMMRDLDTDSSGEVSLSEFATFWKSKFSGTLVEGSKLAALMAQFADSRQIDGVAYHPCTHKQFPLQLNLQNCF